MVVKPARSRAKWIPFSSHVLEDQLLGEGVLGLRHLFSAQEFPFAHLPVDTCQDAEDVILLCATKKKAIGYLKKNLFRETKRGREGANSS